MGFGGCFFGRNNSEAVGPCAQNAALCCWYGDRDGDGNEDVDGDGDGDGVGVGTGTGAGTEKLSLPLFISSTNRRNAIYRLLSLSVCRNKELFSFKRKQPDCPDVNL